MWQSAGNQDGSSNGVYGRRYDASGAADGGEFLINETTTSSQSQGLRVPQSLVQLDNGTVVATWYGNGIGDTSGIFARIFSVGAVNQAPVVDLNGATAGIDTSGLYTEDTAALKLIPNVVVSDTDSANLTGATVTIASGFVAGDIMRVNNSLSGTTASGINYNYDTVTGILTLSGSASVANYQAALATLQFKTVNDGPGAARDITVTVTDGSATSTAAHITLGITQMNDAPVNNVPLTTQSGASGGNIVFSAANGNAITVSDPDAGSSIIRVKLTADHGTVTVGSTANVTVSGNGTALVFVTGTIANINAALNGSSYHGAAGYVGADTLTINTNDRGGVGAGGQMVDQDSISLNWTPIAPVQTPLHDDKAYHDVSADILPSLFVGHDIQLNHDFAINKFAHDLTSGPEFLG